MLEDGIDMSLTAAKKDFLLERLSKRNKERLNYLDAKLELRNKDQWELEGEDKFSQSFSEKVNSIQTHIDSVRQTSNDLPDQFAEIIKDIQKLEQYLTTSTMFLTDFKIKSCQTVLNELTSSCEEKRQRLMPKKKFGFSGKKMTTKIPVNPRLSLNDKTKMDNKSGCSETNATFAWTVSNRQNEYICLLDDEVNGKDITISNINNCFVELQGHPGSVQISKSHNCILLCGPISRSLFAEHCDKTTLALACQQLRLHSSTSCKIYLHVTCRAIIEDCSQIEVGTYDYKYIAIEEDFKKAGLDKSVNNYSDIADFNWLSPDAPSPNWNLLKNVPNPDWSELRKEFKENLKSPTNL